MNNLVRHILNYLSDAKIKFRKNPETGHVELLLTEHQAQLTIFKDDNWDDLKRCIDRKMSRDKDVDCSICLEDMRGQRVSCPKCANDWCIDCYINIYKHNKGIIRCPYCRFEYGEEYPEGLIDIGVNEILKKAGRLI